MYYYELKQHVRNPVIWLSGTIYLVTILFTGLLQMKSEHSTLFHMNYALSIMLFIAPLFILTLSSMNIAYAQETRWLELLMSYPIKATSYVTIHFMSIVTVYTFLLIIGHMILLAIGVPLNIIFFLLTFIMIIIFSSIAVLIGVISNSRLQAIGFSLVLWTLLLIIIPFILITLNGLVSGNQLLNLMLINIHLNPVDYIRLLYYLMTGQTGILGSEINEHITFLQSSIGIGLTLFNGLIMIGLPFITSYVLLKRRGFE